ncbi:MAG: PKD domain-containing protein [Gemmatimonadota bacterium]
MTIPTISGVRSVCVLSLLATLAACGDGPTGPNENAAPRALVSADVLSGPAPLTVTLDASSSTANDASPLAFVWSFGDGSPSATGPFTNHVFTEPGAFTVTVQVTDAAGTSATASVRITVTEREPLYDLQLNLSNGDYWTFAYRQTRASFTGSGGTSSADAGFLTVKLKAAQDFGGRTLHPIEQLEGGPTSSTPADVDFALPWTHLGVDADGSMIGSRNGATVEVIFDAFGSWTGDGFFDDFSEAELSPLRTGFQNQAIDIQSGSAFRVSTSGSSGGCDTVQTPSGPITLCDEVSTSGSTAEYFLPGVGPLGFRRNGSAGSASGVASGTLRYELIETNKSLGGYAIDRTWRAMASLNLQASSIGAIPHDGKIYAWDRWASGGELRFDVYDPTLDRWVPGPTIGIDPAWCPGGASANSYGTSIVLICGQSGYQAVYHSPDSGSFAYSTTLNPAPGDDCSWQGVDEIWNEWILMFSCGTMGAFRPSANLWDNNAADVPAGANEFEAQLLGSRLFLLGYADSWALDLTNFAAGWIRVPDMPGATDFRPTFRQPSLAQMDEVIYATGGTDGFNHFDEYGIDNILSQAARFDPTSRQWTSLDSMLLYRSGHELVSLNGSLYAIGSSGFDYTRSMERYDP